MVGVCLWGVDGGDVYYTWYVGPPHSPHRGHTRVRVTHPYVEVSDHSDAVMCAKDTSLYSPCGERV